MKWDHYLLLAGLSLGLLLLVTTFQEAPGYMDAEYYYSGGLRLADGHGFSEMVLWNYLDDPGGLPHPSHTYWMPLASILAYLGIKLGGAAAFTSGRLGFLLVSICIPPLTAGMAWRLGLRQDSAMLAGLLAVFPAFYLPYLPTSDTFGLVMLFGACWLMAAQRPVRLFTGRFDLSPLLLGLSSGLLHLARADGFLWLGLALLAVTWKYPQDDQQQGRWWLRLLAVSLGYLAVMGPWFVRNLSAFGSVLAPGASAALWFVDYDDLYAYPASLITPSRWWMSGLGSILSARGWAFGQNLQTIIAVQGGIILAPLITVGVWRLRADRGVRFGLLSWALILLLMTLVFPFAGARGGFFHSGAALQPLFWAAVPAGLDAFTAWGSRRRGWHAGQARRIFQSGIVVLAVVLSLIVVYGRVLGPYRQNPLWNQGQTASAGVLRMLWSAGMNTGDIVMVNNPPGYYLESGLPAISIPNGDTQTLLSAAERYGARFVVLEANHPSGLDELYADPGDRPGMDYLASGDGVHVFEVVSQ